jgi:hypothetical protein
MALTRRWIVTTAAAVVFLFAVVAGTVLIVIRASMTGAHGSH